MGAFDLTVMAWGVERLYLTHKGKMRGCDAWLVERFLAMS
jgi:hypothetical protein